VDEAPPLAEAAERVGGYRWVEWRLFEITGAWSTDADLPVVQLHLHDVSLQHAWHAELWEDRLPVLAGSDPAALTRPPSDAVAAVLDDLERETDTVNRLAGLYRVVLPRLVVTYDDHRRRAVAATEGPVIRALRLIRRDEHEQWRTGERLLQATLWLGDEVGSALTVQRRLETLLAGGPGLWGVGPVPG
jgi:hypothetical protein